MAPEPERIAVDWNRDAVAIDHVNPLESNRVDRIRVVGGSLLSNTDRSGLGLPPRRGKGMAKPTPDALKGPVLAPRSGNAAKQLVGLCQVNRIHSEISVNCRWLLYAISMT